MRNTREQLRLAAIVEGCVDKVVAEWLLDQAGLSGKVIDIAGGWPQVISHTVELIKGGSVASLIAFVDYDDNPDEKYNYLEKLLVKRIGCERGDCVEKKNNK